MELYNRSFILFLAEIKVDSEMNDTIYSIGYSGFPCTDSFIEALKIHDINVVIDVRSTPYSNAFPQYNKEALDLLLNENYIRYRNYAREFGARQENPLFYVNGRLDFNLFSKSGLFQEGVAKVKIILSKGYRLCFMCSEKDPTDCHRSILVTKAFSEQGYRIIHLMPNSKSKTQEDVESELRSKLDLFERSGITDIKQLNLKAYEKQNDFIGYREENL